MLRNIAHAMSATVLETALYDLKNSHAWKSNPLLQQWISKKWLPHLKVCLRKKDVQTGMCLFHCIAHHCKQLALEAFFSLFSEMIFLPDTIFFFT